MLLRGIQMHEGSHKQLPGFSVNYPRNITSQPFQDNPRNDFIKEVLSWPVKNLREPFSRAKGAPVILGKFAIYNEESREAYYKQWEPFIFEEVRIQLYNTIKESKYTSIKIIVKSDLKIAKYVGNISSFQAELEIPENYSEPRTNLVLYIQCFANKHYLALAHPNKENDLFSVKIIIRQEHMHDFSRLIETENSFSVGVLSSLTAYQRMYVACVAPEIPGKLESDMITGRVLSPNSLLQPQFQYFTQNLNKRQKAVVENFNAMENGISVVWGPPGTGKTETLSATLNAIISKKTRDLTVVCAPSNKPLFSLAERLIHDNPDASIFIVGTEDKIPELLRENSVYAFWPLLQELLGTIDKSLDNLNFKSLLHYSGDKTIRMMEELQNISTAIEEVKNKVTRATPLIAAELTDCFATANKSLSCFAELVVILKNDNKFWKKLKHKKLSETTTLELKMYDVFNEDIKSLTEAVRSFAEKNDKEEVLLQNANVIITTLVCAGRSIFKNIRPVNVVIDEAGLALMPELLIVFGLRPKKLLLAGDPKQLSPIVHSPLSSRCKFSWSLLQHYIDHKIFSHMLNLQYRMLEPVAVYPSERFYGGLLKTHPSVYERFNPLQNFPKELVGCVFYNCYSREKSKENSFYNEEEAEAVLEIIKKYVKFGLDPKDIVVIAAYAAQKDLLQNLMQKKSIYKNVVVDTVDAFQGKQCAVVIVSFVRSNNENCVGFLDDPGRLNVAHTRAEFAFVAVGNYLTLRYGKELNPLLEHLKKNKRFYDSANIKKIGNPILEKQNPISLGVLNVKKNDFYKLDQKIKTKQKWTPKHFYNGQDDKKEKISFQCDEPVPSLIFRKT